MRLSSVSSQPPVSIMILEDNPADISLLKHALHEVKIDFTAIVFEDGESALRYIEDEAQPRPIPDLAILDLNVPKHDGLEVLASIRCHPGWQDMAVVVFSSSPEHVMQDRAKEADRYITKPSELDELLRTGEQIRGCAEAVWAARLSRPQILNPWLR